MKINTEHRHRLRFPTKKSWDIFTFTKAQATQLFGKIFRPDQNRRKSSTVTQENKSPLYVLFTCVSAKKFLSHILIALFFPFFQV